MFWITAFVYAFGVVFFALTVSGDRQPWNDMEGDGRNTDTIESADEPARSISMSPNSEAKLTDVRKLSSPKGDDKEDKDETDKNENPKDEEEKTKDSSPQSPQKETPTKDENEEDKEEAEGAKKIGGEDDEKAPTTPTTTNTEEKKE